MWRTSLASPLLSLPCCTLFRSDTIIRFTSSKSNARPNQQSFPRARGAEKASKTKPVLSSQREPSWSDPTSFGLTNSSPPKTTLKKATGILQQSVVSRDAPSTSGVVSARPSAAHGSASSSAPFVSLYVAPAVSDLRPRSRLVSQSQKVDDNYTIYRGDSQQFTLPSGLKLGYAIFGSKSPKSHAFVKFHGTPGTRLSSHTYHQWGLENGVSIICPERPGYSLSSLKKYTVLEHAQDVQALMSSLGHTTYKVIGTSGGGPYALGLNYAAGRTIVLGTVLMVPAPPPEAPQDGLPLKSILWRKRIRWLPSLTRMQFLWRNKEYHLKADKNRALYSPEVYRMFADGSKHLVNREQGHSSSAEGYIQDWCAISRNWGFKLNSFHPNQILVFAGGLDENTPLSSIRWMCRQLRNTKLIEERARNHYNMQEYTFKALEYLKRM